MKQKGKQMKDVDRLKVLRLQQEWSENNSKSGGMVRSPESDFVEDMPFTYERYGDGFSPNVIFRVMEKLADEGLLEYGVSLRTAWLTDKAKELLK